MCLNVLPKFPPFPRYFPITNLPKQPQNSLKHPPNSLNKSPNSLVIDPGVQVDLCFFDLFPNCVFLLSMSVVYTEEIHKGKILGVLRAI